MTGFSQNATQQIDTSQIVLSTEVARKVAIDLVEGDQAKEQVSILQESLRITEEILSNRDSLVNILEQENASFSQVLLEQRNKLQTYQVDQEKITGNLKKARAYAVGFGISTVLVTTLSIILLTK